jgi:hypothetical protein
LPRHPPHHFEHPPADDVAPRKLLFDHAGAETIEPAIVTRIARQRLTACDYQRSSHRNDTQRMIPHG